MTTYYVNVYPDGQGAIWKNRKSAEKFAGSDRLYLIKVTLKDT